MLLAASTCLPCVMCSPSKQQMGAPMRIGDGCSFNSIKTSNFKLHYLESPSGLKVSIAFIG
jgi:hypothetical protein